MSPRDQQLVLPARQEMALVPSLSLYATETIRNKNCCEMTEVYSSQVYHEKQDLIKLWSVKGGPRLHPG